MHASLHLATQTTLKMMLTTLKAHNRIEASLLDNINSYLASMSQVAPTPAPVVPKGNIRSPYEFAQEISMCCLSSPYIRPAS